MGNWYCTGKLSKSDAKFLQERTSFTKPRLLKWHQEFLKKCPRGRMTPAIFTAMYQELFPDGDPTDFSKYVFQLTDVDRKGYIDFKEFLLLINVTSYGTAVEKLRWAFRLYDINGDGKINLQQMTHIVNALMKMVGPHLDQWTLESARKKAAEMFRTLDTHGVGYLTEEHFVYGCLEDEQLAPVNLLGKKRPDN